MKPLTASKIIPGRKQELIKLDDLFDLPNRSDENYMDYLATVMKTWTKEVWSTLYL